MNSSTQKPNLQKGCLLVIEDGQDQWILMKLAIKSAIMGVKPIRVTNPKEALAYLNDCLTVGVEFPSMILLDLYLPEREMGWHLLHEIRSLPAPVNLIPIVMLSSSNDQGDISNSYNRGITAYMVKPTDTTSWVETFQMLGEYWLKTVSLPNHTNFW
ncbi:response regulator [Larkinella terrae]|uniref:Response regulator n=1 Tax=Larkinella terrae TaxID=2025311 RepID=A0A7K0EIL3_9BACT|nr:response regulator [Larkinella terrae]MRS61647.1 response regulator [Larkinella terrae]